MITQHEDQASLDRLLEQHRVELTGYCYRMLGSSFEAEDAVQESLVRAWRGFEGFEGRASFRSWLYRIATNVCLNMVRSRQRRARPMDLGPAWSADSALEAALDEATWIEPVPDHLVLRARTDPAEQAALREGVRLAFVAALQWLPPRQRAVLILQEVLHWKASEVADLLGVSLAAVNSALQRARATLAVKAPEVSDSYDPQNEAQRALLARYVDVFERWDVEAFVSLLHEDATLSMPPYALWLRGKAELHRWWLGPGSKCQGSHLVQVAANGMPAFAQYKPSGPGGSLEPFAIHVLEISGGRIRGHNSFLDVARLFPAFGLPLQYKVP